MQPPLGSSPSQLEAARAMMAAAEQRLNKQDQIHSSGVKHIRRLPDSLAD
jgi:hypothetical protein